MSVPEQGSVRGSGDPRESGVGAMVSGGADEMPTHVVLPQPEAAHPIVALTDADLAAMLKRAMRLTVMLGAALAAVVAISSGWRNGVALAVGAGIAALSLMDWLRLVGLVNARMDGGKLPRGTALVVGLFLLRLILFGGAIYGSLKWLGGSPIALAFGLGLAVVGLVWEAMRLLRG